MSKVQYLVKKAIETRQESEKIIRFEFMMIPSQYQNGSDFNSVNYESDFCLQFNKFISQFADAYKSLEHHVVRTKIKSESLSEFRIGDAKNPKSEWGVVKIPQLNDIIPNFAIGYQYRQEVGENQLLVEYFTFELTLVLI